jgi:hypothetical protein
MVGDREQPAAQVRGIDAVQALQGADKSFLQNVFRLMVVAQDANQELKEGHLVAGKQHLQRLLIPQAEAFEQRRVRNVRHAPTRPFFNGCANGLDYLNRRRAPGQASTPPFAEISPDIPVDGIIQYRNAQPAVRLPACPPQAQGFEPP